MAGFGVVDLPASLALDPKPEFAGFIVCMIVNWERSKVMKFISKR